MKKANAHNLLACLAICLCLGASPAHAASLSNFMQSCSHNETLRDEGLSNPGDSAEAFYCRGFISGLYAGLLSGGKIKEGTCSARYIDIERLLTFVSVYYKEEKAREKGSELALFESQPPEWFLEKALIKACSPR